jgi:hypothetical protein
MHPSKLPCFTAGPSIPRPVLFWEGGLRYKLMDSADVQPEFEKLNPIEVRLSRAGVTNRIKLRVFANRRRPGPKLPTSTPIAVRKASIGRGRQRIRIRAPRNFSDCAYTRLLDRLAEGEPGLDDLFAMRRTERWDGKELVHFPHKHEYPHSHICSVLYMPSAGPITSKGQDASLDFENLKKVDSAEVDRD